MWVVMECEVRIGRTKYVPRRGASSNGQDEVLSASDKMIDPQEKHRDNAWTCAEELTPHGKIG